MKDIAKNDTMVEELIMVLRPTKTDHSILPLIAGRWSSRAIDPNRDVDEAAIARLLEAARWAPSSNNNQPWAYVVATRRNKPLLEAARRSLMKGNAWALQAPVLIFSLSRKNYPGKLIPNPLHKFEAGMAAQNMAIQAAEDGLVFHQMFGFWSLIARRAFAIPFSYSILTAIAVGYPGTADSLPERQRAKEIQPRTRAPQSAFAHIDDRFQR